MVFIFLCLLAHESLEVLSSIAVPLGLGQLDEDAGGRWTSPGGVNQGLSSIFAIPELEEIIDNSQISESEVRNIPEGETSATELPPTHSTLLQTVFMSVVFCLYW